MIVLRVYKKAAAPQMDVLLLTFIYFFYTSASNILLEKWNRDILNKDAS